MAAAATMTLEAKATKAAKALQASVVKQFPAEDEKIVIANHGEYASIADALFTVKEEQKDATAKRDYLLEEPKGTIAKVTAIFAPALLYLEKQEERIKNALRAYALAGEEAQQKALTQAAALARVGQTDKSLAIAARAEESLAPQVKGISFSGKVKIEIADESMIPEEFWRKVVDVKKLQAAVDGGARGIPGVLVHARVIAVRTDRRVKED